MTEQQIKELEKAVNKAKFMLSQKAGALHDLIEDRLPADFKEIPEYAEATYQAGLIWEKLNEQLLEKKK